MTSITNNYPGKKHVNRAIIKQSRKYNQTEARKIRNSLEKIPSAGFVFIPDTDEKGSLFAKRHCPIVGYDNPFTVGTELADDAWEIVNLDPNTFKGEVYSIGLFQFMPTLVWSSEIA